MHAKKNLLLITDLYYVAKGREYFREDLELSSYLRKYFHVWISHVDDINSILKAVDCIFIRNSGPQSTHQKQLKLLQNNSKILLLNNFSGKGDIQGKNHLLELFKLGFPVIPTVKHINEIEKLGECEFFILKPIDSCDSQGIETLNKKEILHRTINNKIIQPLLDFMYEVSFYFLDNQLHYALYAPDPNKRWELVNYSYDEKDEAFARQFIAWNSCSFGIQRVDACRLKDGSLLLMELEDYNPFLSFQLLPRDTKENFLESLCQSLLSRIDNNG